ncbi:MAG: class I SAM-dependent methyltransferase [Myxococcaceae bacterium]
MNPSDKVPYRAAEHCRICGNPNLVSVLDLGSQSLTGVFPRANAPQPGKGPLELLKCHGPAGSVCDLVQLRHSYDTSAMYGANYGYRSGLNRSMVEHLTAKVRSLTAKVPVGQGDVVLDIGSNDGTTLSCYPTGGATLIGIDPTAAKFARYYPKHVQVVADFFTADNFRKIAGTRKAKIVTSIAMFYDLERPMDFARDVAAVLADDGIWHFEQSYLPSMLAATSYDTICHEHVEYYALHQIKWMTDRAGLRLVDVSLNAVNGGSFAVTVAKAKGGEPVPSAVSQMLEAEAAAGLATLAPYEKFAKDTFRHRHDLLATLARLKKEGKKVFGLGASTKGNVLLQFCGLGAKDLACIAEVNEDKFGCVTPGSAIPIVADVEARAQKPDVFLVLPWHFREGLLEREAAFIAGGGRLLFPLPKIEMMPAHKANKGPS